MPRQQQGRHAHAQAQSQGPTNESARGVVVRWARTHQRARTKTQGPFARAAKRRATRWWRGDGGGRNCHQPFARRCQPQWQLARRAGRVARAPSCETTTTSVGHWRRVANPGERGWVGVIAGGSDPNRHICGACPRSTTRTCAATPCRSPQLGFSKGRRAWRSPRG